MNKTQRYIDQQATQWLAASGLEIEAIDKLSQYTHVITRFFKGDSWLFRGEKELYEYPATPSVLRGAPELSRDRYPSKAITDQEIEAVEACQRDRPDGSDRYVRAFMPSFHPMDANWLPLARHFGYATRLLDVSANPLVALYFACAGSSSDDAYVYTISRGNCRPVNERNGPQENSSDCPPIPINFLDLYDVDVEFNKPNLDDILYHFEASIPQERLQAQAGSFLFWRNLQMEVPSKVQLIPIRIRGSSRSELLSDLSAFGVTEAILFPNAK